MRHAHLMKNASQDSPELLALIRRLNLDRGLYLSTMLLIFQALGLVNQPWHERLSIQISSLLLAVLCVAYIVGMLAFKPRILEHPRLSRGWVHMFWFLLMICMGPHIAEDIRLSTQSTVARPLNASLLALMLAAVPIFTWREILSMYAIFLAENVLLCVLLKASISYLVFMSALLIACILFSVYVQYRYIRMVWQYKTDSCQDELTAILNRKGGLERMRVILALARRHGQQLAVYMVDIDHFKKYNDALGHLQGDTVLNMVAQSLSRVFVRDSDVIFRFGGEEFVICTPISRPAETNAMGCRLVEAVRTLKILHPLPEYGPYLSVSVGSVHYAPQGNGSPLTAEELIDLADHAMYLAKQAGGDRYMNGGEAFSGRKD